MAKGRLGALCMCVLLGGFARAETRHQYKLWGLDAADAQLFAIRDVREPRATFADYGSISYVENGKLVDVGDSAEAFTVITERRAFAAVNRDIGEYRGPVLLEVNLREATPSMPIVAKVRGSLAPEGLAPGTRITGIAGDPIFGEMYALASDDDPSTPDTLVVAMFGANNFVTARTVGPITMGDDRVSGGGDVAIGPGGMLLVTDNDHGRVVMVDPASATIRGTRFEGIGGTGSGAGGGVGPGSSASLSAAVWDAVNDRTTFFDKASRRLMVESYDDRRDFESFDLTDLGITDAEGLAFVLDSEIEENFDPGFTDRISTISGHVVGNGGGGGRRGGGGGGGAGGGGRAFPALPPELQPLAMDEGLDDLPEPEMEPEDPEDMDPIDPDEEVEPDDETPDVPSPGVLSLAALAAWGATGGRRRRSGGRVAS